MHCVRRVLDMDTQVEVRIGMVHRGFGCSPLLALIVVAVAMLSISASPYAGVTEEDVPATSIVPGEGATSAAGSPAAASTLAPAGVVTPTAPTAKSKPATRHRSTTASSREAEIEPAQGRLQLLEDAWVYSAPAKNSKHIKRATKDKYV